MTVTAMIFERFLGRSAVLKYNLSIEVKFEIFVAHSTFPYLMETHFEKAMHLVLIESSSANSIAI